MSLSSDLISQFVKITNDTKDTKTNNTIYGTVVEYEGAKYVKLDGSELLTPMSSTTVVNNDDRVMVQIENHTATITGNLTTPSASSKDVNDLGSKISEFDTIVSYKISTQDLEAFNATLENLTAVAARIENADIVNAEIEALKVKMAEMEYISATDADIINADIERLEAEFGKFTDISAEDAEIVNAEITNLKTYTADFAYVSAEVLSAIKADIKSLDVEKLSAKDADLKYANIDFSNIGEAAVESLFSKSGIIEDLIVSDGKITGELVGVTIKGDLIEGNTIKAEKLVVKGSDGLYYKLNIEGGATTSEEVSEEQLQNGLSGSVIIAKSITAEKVAVDDLVAFNATIGGFHITDNSIYSGAKESVDNTTRGIYLDNDGQIVFGDSSNYLKFFKDADGSYKLNISASYIRMGGSSLTIQEEIDEVKNYVDDLEIGAKNLLTNSSFTSDLDDWTTSGVEITEIDGVSCGYISGEFEVAKYAYQNIIDKIDPTDLEQTYVYSADVRLDNFVKGETSPYVAIYFSGQRTKEDGSIGYFNGTTVSGNPLPSKHNGEGWVRLVWVLTFPYVATHLNAYVYAKDFTGDLYFKNLKLEKGHKATDWTPAPEDLADADSVDTNFNDVNERLENTITRITGAEQLIDSINGIIQNLVTDENGTSLMTQTSSGWTFNISGLQDALNKASSDLGALTEELGSVDATTAALSQAISDLEHKTERINIGTFEDEPCISWSETDSTYKLLITNTRIIFMQGEDILTYINTRGLVTTNIKVENELAQGEFVWKIHGNGNLGLMWKGADN